MSKRTLAVILLASTVCILCIAVLFHARTALPLVVYPRFHDGASAHAWYARLTASEWRAEFEAQCAGRTLFSLSSKEPCSFDFVFHYVDYNRATYDETVRELVRRSYEYYKPGFASSTILSPSSNQITITVLTLRRLGLLGAQDRAFWVSYFASAALNPERALFPQQYDRVWFYTDMGIDNRSLLPNAPASLCAYQPSLTDISTQNIFREAPTVLLQKFIYMRSFCDQPLSPTELTFVRENYEANYARWSGPDSKMSALYEHLIALPTRP